MVQRVSFLDLPLSWFLERGEAGGRGSMDLLDLIEVDFSKTRGGWGGDDDAALSFIPFHT